MTGVLAGCYFMRPFLSLWPRSAAWCLLPSFFGGGDSSGSDGDSSGYTSHKDVVFVVVSML